MKVLKSLAVAGALSLTASLAVAADVATVNGQDISQAMLDENVKANVAQGQKDTPELRQTILNELINRVLLVQSAEKAGLTRTTEAKVSVEQLKENFEAGLAINEYMRKHPVTDADVRADYDRQVAALGGSKAQINLSMMVLKTKIEADDVIAQLKKKGDFAAIARDRSVAPSKAQGGLVGWVLPAQLPPELATAAGQLKKGSMTQTPIELQGAWYVLKVNDTRPFKVPTFDESKDRIRAALTQQRRAEQIKALRESAQITVH